MTHLHSFGKAVILFCALASFHCAAQDLDPRRYFNIPIGQNFLALAYSYTEGDVSTTPSAPLQDAFLRIDGPALAYLRTFELNGKSASVDILQPWVCWDGNALLDGERVSGDHCGYGDTKLRLSYNFYGAPAMELAEYATSQRETVVGASLQVNIPVGDYHAEKLINVGSNRWYIRPEIGATIPYGKWSFELAAGVRFFTDNDDYLEGSVLEQDPLYNIQAHVHYDLTRRHLLSVSSNYFFGGTTYRDGVESAIEQSNARLGLSWTYVLNSNHLLKLIANTGVVTRIGNDSDAITVAWSYRWD